jgi:hypothetical protein
MVNLPEVRWSVDVAMGITFIITFMTGLLKWTLLMRMFGLTGIVFPLALMSDIHDWAGFFLGVFVAVHLFLNRSWIISTTKRMLAGKPEDAS